VGRRCAGDYRRGMKYVLAILPSVGVAFLFWWAVRAMLTADRRERAAHARMTRYVSTGTLPGAKGSSTQGNDTTPNG
jgi:threonine/homoserine/homoserine lactone efflux protein